MGTYSQPNNNYTLSTLNEFDLSAQEKNLKRLVFMFHATFKSVDQNYF